jgi:hypothetical protein
VQQAPAALPPVGGVDELLLPSAPAAELTAADAKANQWALSPTSAVEAAPGRRSERAEANVGSGASTSTVWAWLVAISPILAAGSITYVLLATKAALASWPFEAAVAAPYLLVLLFAVADRSALLTHGYERPRSPLWALATAPIYLIQRGSFSRPIDGSGTRLTLVWFASFIVAIAGIVGYGLITHTALISGLPT